MSLHLLKTAAGLQEIDQLVERQKQNEFVREGRSVTYAYTRYMPKRAEEILAGAGSIYWILKNRIQVRQKILGFEKVSEEGAHEWCRIVLDPDLYKTYSVQKRAIQGWRYLEVKGAPKDHGRYVSGLRDDEPPPEMAEELRKLGLL